jgi:hypothetical protein
MADKKISQLTGATTPLTGTEELAIVQGGQTLKATAQDIADLGSGGSLPVLNTYPVTTSASAGTRFWYKGNEWHYMTQDEINSAGWTGLVSVGFPAPVTKCFNGYLVAPESNMLLAFDTGVAGGGQLIGQTSFIDFLGYGLPNKRQSILLNGLGASHGLTVTEFKNANLLLQLVDFGTIPALFIRDLGLSSSLINNLFTQLPTTTRTATIDVRNNPGAATCNTSIATGKGYTVITS